MKMRLPSIAEEKLYVDKGDTVSGSFQGWTENNTRKAKFATDTCGVVSSWLKMCQENLKKVDTIQQEIAKKKIPFKTGDELEVNEFTMFENMFEAEAKLKSACLQFQRIALTVKDRALRSQKELANKAPYAQANNLKHTLHCSKEVKLPPVKHLCRLRATKDIGRPINKVQSAPQSVVNRPGAEQNISSSLTAARPTLLHREHMKGRSKLPVRDASFTTKEFVFCALSKRKFSSQQSKLPLRKLTVAKHLGSQQKTKFLSSNIGALSSDRLHSRQEFKADVIVSHTMSNPLLPIPPIPPVGGCGVRTSTNLRMRHFNHQ